MTLRQFRGRILVIGCGGVSRCTLPLLLRHLDMPRDKITVIDALDRRDVIEEVLAEGVNFVQTKIEQASMDEQLAAFVGAGDLIIDLAWNIGCTDILSWCHDHDVMYINTSVELWDPYTGADQLSPTDRTLYVRHMAIREMVAGWSRPGPTAVLEHGANPGLVSHFTKQALLDIAERIEAENPRDRRVPALGDAVSNEQYNRIARLVGLKVLHISEKDTQVTSQPRPHGEFLNTWSVEGLFEEATAPAELGWGTHEQNLPADACRHQHGPRNQICLERTGMNTFVRSRVPSGEIVGMVIRHGEAFTISDALTVHSSRGRTLYRPTVHYAYMPCEAAVQSLDELRQRNYELQKKWRILQEDDIASGWDELGCLLMGHDFKSWWTGSILTIEEAGRLVKGQNATTLQVAASVLAAVCWMIDHPQEGVKIPDQLPHREIMAVAAPYLGDVVSIPIDWMPDADDNLTVPSHEFNQEGRTPWTHTDEHWQFDRFLVSGV